MKIDKQWNFSAAAGKIIFNGKKVFKKLNNIKSTFREIDG
jgi:hypothetical protein